jgi:POTRA domain, FtsQ-type
MKVDSRPDRSGIGTRPFLRGRPARLLRSVARLAPSRPDRGQPDPDHRDRGHRDPGPGDWRGGDSGQGDWGEGDWSESDWGESDWGESERHRRPADTGRVPIDPRFARRWTQVRREQGRRRLRIMVAVVAVVALIAAGVGSLYAPWLSLRHVRLTTAGAVPRSEVLFVTGLGHRRPLIEIDTGAVAARLDAVADLGGARVRRSWPTTLDIHVTLRTPVAVVARPSVGRAAPVWATVDATGRVLADVVAPPVGLPVLEGVGPVPPPGAWLTGSPGPRSDPLPATTDGAAASRSLVDLDAEPDAPTTPAGTAAALAIASALPVSIRTAVLSVRAGPGDQLTLSVLPLKIASGSIAVALGDGSLLAQKLTALVALLTEANLSGATGINLTVPDRPAVLTARQSAGTVSTLAEG